VSADGAQVSVVLCAHNEAGVIERQLSALAAQACDEPWEVVVVDHRSTDGTGGVAEAYRDRLPRLTVLRLDSGSSLAHARNAGVRQAQGSKILMCDADDEVRPGWLQAMADALKVHAVVGARLDPSSINPPWLVRSRGTGQVDALPTYLGLPWSYGAGLGFRRLVFDAVGGFDERLLSGGEDTDFGVRAGVAGFRAEFLADAVVWYRFREDALSAYRQGRSNGRAEALLMLLHGSRADRRAWWRHNLIELPRLALLVGAAALLRNRTDRRVRRVAYARRIGRILGRFQGALRYGCRPW